jgi:hypothetical protein
VTVVARIEQWTRDGDKLPTVETDDPDVIEAAENAHTDDGSNISRTRVT